MRNTAGISSPGKTHILQCPGAGFAAHAAVALGVWKFQKNCIANRKLIQNEAFNNADALKLEPNTQYRQQEPTELQEDEDICYALFIEIGNKGAATKVKLGAHNVKVIVDEKGVNFHLTLPKDSLRALAKAHIDSSTQQELSMGLQVAPLSTSRKLPLWRSYAMADLPPKKRSRILTCCTEDGREDKQNT